MTANPTTLASLQHQLVDTTPLLGERRRRRAAERLAEFAREASSDAIAALTQAIASGPDASVSEIATSALHSLPEGPARDVLCRLAVENDDEVALSIATTGGYTPSEPFQRAALLALTGRWEELEAFDLDDRHLLSAYETGSAELRRRLAAAARAAGRAEWVQVAVGGRQRLRLAEMTASEWQDVIDLLARPDRANEAWRLAQEAPPQWARALLLAIEDGTALPECDHEYFALLRALAVPCDEGEIPFSACESCTATLGGHEDQVFSLAVTPDGRLLASGSDDRTIRLWRLPDKACVATLRGHEGSIRSLAATPDGTLLASGSRDKTIRLWRLSDGECAATLRGHKDWIESLAVTPDGRLLASGSDDRTIRLWRLSDGECAATLRGHKDWITSLAVTPDGNLLASGGTDSTIRLWRLADKACVATLRGHEGSIRSLAATPDGTLLASGGDDHTIRLWRLADGSCAATLRGHETSVHSLAVASDVSMLASGSRDRTIRLWRLPHGEPVATLRRYEFPFGVHSLTVTSDGSLLASGSSEGTIRLWQSPVAVPASVLAPDIDCLLALRSDDGLTAHGRAWLDFILALVDRHRRFDIEVEVCDHVEVGEFDIEIGGRE